jgi:hypothetical protein
MMGVRRVCWRRMVEIIRAVRQLERDLALIPGRGVFPWQVQARLDVSLHEATLRRKMAAIAADGLLIRVGGEGARRGYRARLWTWEWSARNKTLDYWQRRYSIPHPLAPSP